MAAHKNPVEKRIELMRDLWLDATADPKVEVLVWRVPDNATQMLLAFFEAQRLEGDWQAPDLFLKFDAPFETGFSYSRMLCDALIESYVASKDSFKEQEIPFNWAFAAVPRSDSAAGFINLLNGFAKHHQKLFRFAVATLMPSPVTSDTALKTWAQAAIKSGLAENVRLGFVESASGKQWSWLLKELGAKARLIEPPIDMFDVARETAAQSPGTGPAVAYRQLLADVLALVERGTPAQVSARADKAIKIAEREKWHDQQVVLHMAVAGSHLKAQDHAAAIRSYRQARGCAEEAKRQGNPVGGNLVMQTWFGEAGAWLVAKQYRHAAQAYRSGAEEAQRISNLMFSLEGFRMAAFCYALNGDKEDARQHGALAIREGKAIPADERVNTTLTVALHDLLRLQDAASARQLEQLAEIYQEQIASAHADAEKQGALLGGEPKNEAIDKIENEMHAKFETSFQALREKREQVISRGDEYFCKVVAIGRELLNPQWNGMPEVKHPLDKEQASWAKMPQSAKLPDTGDLIDDKESTSNLTNKKAGAELIREIA